MPGSESEKRLDNIRENDRFPNLELAGANYPEFALPDIFQARHIQEYPALSCFG
jgi:hypothetical protein